MHSGANYGTNAVLGDYQLVYPSPCFDTGTTLAWMNGATDILGAERVQGNAVDMGAYEMDPPPRGTVVVIR